MLYQTNDVAERFISSLLLNDSTIQSLVSGRVYNDEGPNNATYPFIIYGQQAAADDIMGMGGVRRLSPLLYLIQAVGRVQTYDSLYPIAQKIDDLINDQGSYAVPGGGRILFSYRVRTHKMPQDLQSISYRYLGGIYRIEVEAI